VQTAQLGVQEAVLLAHPLVARLADQVDVRVLFIKGPTAVAVGARPSRPSSDVDVLVQPDGFEGLCGAFERAGWQLRAPIGTLKHAADLAFDHSAHFIHPDWPCDVDLHYLFPGFLSDPAEVFEALWDRHDVVDIAGREVPSPGLLGQALVVGLHALRDPDRTYSQADLAHLQARLSTLSERDRRGLRDLARATGSSGSASELLLTANVVPAPLDDDERARLADWHRRQAGLGSSTAWLAELRRAPWRAKPGVLRLAVLPPRHFLMSSHLAPCASRSTIAVLHVRRWARGLRALPRAVRLLSRTGGDRAR
jgi:hypothetical protein